MARDSRNRPIPKKHDGTTSKSTKERLRELLWSPAIVLALASAFAYLCAYIYEISFCNYFGIPHDLIVVNWARFFTNVSLIGMVPLALILPVIGQKWQNISLLLFIIMFSVIASIFSLWFCYGYSWQLSLPLGVLIFLVALVYLWQWLKKREWLKKLNLKCEKSSGYIRDMLSYRVFLIFLVMFVLATFILWFYVQILVNQTWHWGYMVVPIGIGYLSAMVTSFLNGKKEALNKYYEFWRHYPPVLLIISYSGEDEFDTIPERFSKVPRFLRLQKYQLLKWFKTAIVTLSIFSFLWICVEMGWGEASGNKEYLVQFSNQSLVLLRIYGDKAVCAAVNNESGKFYLADTGQFLILPLENITLIPQEIGPLHVKSSE